MPRYRSQYRIVSLALASASEGNKAYSFQSCGQRLPPLLANALNRRILEGPLSGSKRSCIRAWAEEAISPKKGAEYLMDIIAFCETGHAGQRPVPPWRKPVK